MTKVAQKSKVAQAAKVSRIGTYEDHEGFLAAPGKHRASKFCGHCCKMMEGKDSKLIIH